MKTSRLLPALLLLAACGEVPGNAYTNPGDPERQLRASTEVVNVSLYRNGSLAELNRVLNHERPTRAQLNCSLTDALCSEARMALAGRGIPLRLSGQGDDVALYYDKIEALDCDQTYKDDSSNVYNAYPQHFGCSVRANTVQSVANKQQFTNPSLMDFPDAAKANQTYGQYMKPTVRQGTSGSLLKTGASSSQ